MMPQAINFHHYNKDASQLASEFGDNWMYVGRENRGLGLARSPLANPFVNTAGKNGRVVADPVAAYRKWLWGKVVQGDTAVMNALAQMDEATGLVCWCKPHPCHADVITAAWEYLAYGQFANPMETPTHALSIRQPWAWLIVRPDVMGAHERGRLYLSGEMKVAENRTWHTNYRGHFYVHAAKIIDKQSVDYVRLHWPHIRLPDEYETGGIVGQAKLLDCVEGHGSRWRVAGQKQFVLAEIRPLRFRELRGQQRFFEVANDLV